MKKSFVKLILSLYLLCLGTLSFGQILSSGLLKTKINIGEPNTLKITVSGLNDNEAISADKAKLLPYHFHIIKDKISRDKEQYTRVIDFTIYEEGTFNLPALDFKIGSQTQKTIPYTIEVGNSVKDGEKINDIMNNKQVDLGLRDYWQLYKLYVLIAIIIICFIILAYGFIKYGRKKSAEKKSPANQTIKALEKLKAKKYIEKEDYRSFYVELIDITRGFLTSQYHIPADVLLTDDLIDLMKKEDKISSENEKIVEEVFLRGDQVKFAKTIPDKSDAEKDYKDITGFVKRSYRDIEFDKLRNDV
ncbi:BatD family protein [Riemerella columbipharyngis]|uniref:Oxygen tolerance n=1 Tax=Riemerella columbipharyngis TaxID=1071918 RepID=A0A1G6Y2P1_9FLAO|nr:BatD family protein [Riemerella columbipharyngis]SDD84572.1 hypothetical protein SAMN05421544_1016 [Riemerella columbipharyngis]